jgi:hypothetical protein
VDAWRNRSFPLIVMILVASSVAACGGNSTSVGPTVAQPPAMGLIGTHPPSCAWLPASEVDTLLDTKVPKPVTYNPTRADLTCSYGGESVPQALRIAYTLETNKAQFTIEESGDFPPQNKPTPISGLGERALSWVGSGFISDKFVTINEIGV